MRFRWPLVRRSTYEAVFAEVRDRDCQIVRLDETIADLSDEVRDCHAALAGIRAASIPLAVPFWLGLPNEILNLIVTTNMDGLQATLGGLGWDEEGDDPRTNLSLPFALRPIR